MCVAEELPKIQVAALPYRRRGKHIEVLLITSRETRRWIIPKGWQMLHLQDYNAAKREALEEAGTAGRIGKTALGQFDYVKNLKGGASQKCRVVVYPLEVKALLRDWKERGQRTRKWFSADQASRLVQVPFLRSIILGLG